jgi:hypothetical protein
MLAILIRHNTAEQRKTLKATDVVIDPALGDFSSLDFNQHTKAMRIGEQAARGQSERLAALSIPADEFQRLVDARAMRRSGMPEVKFLRVEEGSERYAGAIEALFSDQVGKPVNVPKLEKRVGELYGQGNLETFDYRLVQADPERGEEPGYGLSLNTRRNSWGPNYLRFGLQLQNDFEGNSSFNAAARTTMAEITRYGGEWVVDLQVGETPPWARPGSPASPAGCGRPRRISSRRRARPAASSRRASAAPPPSAWSTGGERCGPRSGGPGTRGPPRDRRARRGPPLQAAFGPVGTFPDWSPGRQRG